MKATADQEQNKQRGSFGIPPQQAPAAAKTEAAPEVPATPQEEMAKEVLDAQRIEHNKVLESIQKNLGFTIEKEDIIEFVRKGRITKQIDIIPGVLKVAFQTHSGEDAQAIQEKINVFQNEKATTQVGIQNDSAFWNLAYGLAGYQGKDLTGMDKAKVKEMITKLGAHVADKLNAAFLDFNFVVRSKMNDPELIKK